MWHVSKASWKIRGVTHTFPTLEFDMEFSGNNSMLGNWNFLLVYGNIFAHILQVDHNSTSLKMLLIKKLSVESLHELLNIICVFFNFPRMPFHIVVLKRVITAKKWNSKAKIKN